MQKIDSVSGKAVPLFLDDIDTDRIIPARYLRCVTFEGLGAHVFEDDRKQDAAHPFDDARFQGAKILIAGRNFGCGSSREHAPQALMRWGIAAVVAESYAEIFFGNCTSLGIPCVTAARADLQKLIDATLGNPSGVMTVDLLKNEVRAGDVRAASQMPDSARGSLTTGQWDFLGQLLDGATEIRKSAATIPYLNRFGA